MKTTVNTILLAVLLSLAANGLHAQSHYYGLSGDTIRDRCPTYMYLWDWHGRVQPTGDYDAPHPQTDSMFGPSWDNMGWVRYRTDTAVRVVGIAFCVRVVDGTIVTGLNHPEVFEPGAPQYLRLYDATPDGIVERASVCWTDDYATRPKRQMEVIFGLSHAPNITCDMARIYPDYFPVIECYFDSAISVTDSFYIGSTSYDVYPYELPVMPERFTEVVTEENLAAWQKWMADLNDYYQRSQEVQRWREQHYHQKIGLKEIPLSSGPTDCLIDLPSVRIMNQTGLRDGDTTFHYFVSNDHIPLIFPIIEIDTSGIPYDTARLDCFAPDTFALQHRFRNGAIFSWNNARFNTAAQLSVVALGGNPGDGRLVDATATSGSVSDLNPDSAYDIYLRAWCDLSQRYSQWVGPLTLSSFNAVATTAPAPDFSLTPNPAHSAVTVSLQQPLPGATLTLLDLQGRTLRTLTLDNKTSLTLPLDTLAPGTYLLRLDTPQASATRKLTVD